MNNKCASCSDAMLHVNLSDIGVCSSCFLQIDVWDEELIALYRGLGFSDHFIWSCLPRLRDSGVLGNETYTLNDIWSIVQKHIGDNAPKNQHILDLDNSAKQVKEIFTSPFLEHKEHPQNSLDMRNLQKQVEYLQKENNELHRKIAVTNLKLEVFQSIKKISCSFLSYFKLSNSINKRPLFDMLREKEIHSVTSLFIHFESLLDDASSLRDEEVLELRHANIILKSMFYNDENLKSLRNSM